MAVINQGDCIRAYRPVNNVTERMLCAGVPGGGRDACQVIYREFEGLSAGLKGVDKLLLKAFRIWNSLSSCLGQTTYWV